MEGFQEFEARRRKKFDKQIDSNVMMNSKGLEQGVDSWSCVSYIPTYPILSLMYFGKFSCIAYEPVFAALHVWFEVSLMCSTDSLFYVTG